MSYNEFYKYKVAGILKPAYQCISCDQTGAFAIIQFSLSPPGETTGCLEVVTAFEIYTTRLPGMTTNFEAFPVSVNFRVEKYVAMGGVRLPGKTTLPILPASLDYGLK